MCSIQVWSRIKQGIPILISNLIYAIGDIHGRLDLLTALLDFVAIDAKRRRQEPKVIFLGNIVDRGPDNKWCFELVASTLERWPKSRLILDNHDDWFLRVLGTDEPDPAAVASWVRNGGLSTPYNYDYEADLRMARGAIKIDYQHHISLFQELPFLKSTAHLRSFTQEFILIDQSMTRSAVTAFQFGNRFSNIRSVCPTSLYMGPPSRTRDAHSSPTTASLWTPEHMGPGI